jgi:hypothetical protein
MPARIYRKSIFYLSRARTKRVQFPQLELIPFQLGASSIHKLKLPSRGEAELKSFVPFVINALEAFQGLRMTIKSAYICSGKSIALSQAGGNKSSQESGGVLTRKIAGEGSGAPAWCSPSLSARAFGLGS